MQWKMAITAGALAVAMASGANASVVYNWHPDAGSGGPNAQTTGGTLKISDAAYRSGQVAFNYSTTSPIRGLTLSPDGNHIASSQLEELSMKFYSPTNANTDIFAGGVYFTNELPDFSATAKLVLQPGGLLAGDLYSVDDNTTEYRAQGNGKNWSVFDVGSDAFTGAGFCVSGNLCDAGTGYWQLDTGTIPGSSSNVPAPPAWPLYALSSLGIFGLIGLRRKA